MIAVPSDTILLQYASGVLDPALRLLMDRHLALHPETRERLAAFEHFGGMLLAAEPAAPLDPGTLDRTLGRMAQRRLPAPPPGEFPALDTLAWRWAGPGRAIANIAVPHSNLKTYALKIAPGKAMLQHSHAAEEWTLIVQGSYRDESGDFGAGAFIEEDSDTDHRPVATGEQDCICLAVMSGPVEAPGVMGKVAQWLMR